MCWCWHCLATTRLGLMLVNELDTGWEWLRGEKLGLCQRLGGGRQFEIWSGPKAKTLARRLAVSCPIDTSGWA